LPEEKVSPEKLLPEDEELIEYLKNLKPRIRVLGLGGAGSNTVNRLYDMVPEGVELIAANTDAQHLLTVRAHRKILLGRMTTRGLGAGANPDLGRDATREAMEALRASIEGSDLVIVTAGLGGGTGTGGMPLVARMAKELGALTVAVVSLPFSAEGRRRWENAVLGLKALEDATDSTIVLPNDKILEIVPKLPVDRAFRVMDMVLATSIKGITDLVSKPGIVNLDFNDLRTVMEDSGYAMIGLGEAEGDERAKDATEEALGSPFVEADTSTAIGALINVYGDESMTVQEAEQVAEIVQERTSPRTRIIWGATVDPSLGQKMRVLVILTGIVLPYIHGEKSILKRIQTDLDVVK